MTTLTLSTEHSAACYGQAVLVDESGNAYGAGDFLPRDGYGPVRARYAVALWLATRERYMRACLRYQFAAADADLRRFIGADPTAESEVQRALA